LEIDIDKAPRLTKTDPILEEESEKNYKQFFIAFGTYATVFFLFFILFKLFPGVRLFFIDIIEESGSLNYTTLFICLPIGCLMNMVGIPLSLYEMLMGFFWKSFAASLMVATTYRLIAIFLGYFISTKYLKDMIYSSLEEFKFFKGLEFLTKSKPFQTIFMIRFCYVPSMFKIYVPPILGFNIVHCLVGGLAGSMFYSSINISIGITANSLTGLGAYDDSVSTFTKLLPITMMILGFGFQIYLFFYTKKIVKDLELLDEGDDLGKISKINKFSIDESKKYGSADVIFNRDDLSRDKHHKRKGDSEEDFLYNTL